MNSSSDDSDSENEIITKFMDEDDESDVDYVSPKAETPPKIFETNAILYYNFANVNNYDFKTWKQCFPNNKVSLRSMVFNSGWDDFFDIIESKPYYPRLEEILSDCITQKNKIVIPYPELVFNTLNTLSPQQIKVVIIGQDPYIGSMVINNKEIPQAMGFSFSVPLDYPKPPSLNNIYQNLLDFGHIPKMPDYGCLSFWVMQGCFMINASFTTFLGRKNAHKNMWKNFTDDLLMYINDQCENVVFAVWGADAHYLCINIDPYKHHIITSSHPSPLGFNKELNGFVYGKTKKSNERKRVTYSSFRSTDHFGRINSYLKSHHKIEIFWDLIV